MDVEKILVPNIGRLDAAVLELRKTKNEILSTPDWSTIETLGISASKVDFVNVEPDIHEPEEAKKIRIDNWAQKLEAKKDDLMLTNPDNTYQITYDQTTGLDSLFETKENQIIKRVMYAGKTSTLSQKGVKWDGDRLKIPIYEISYTEWIACLNPKYTDIFEREGLTLPYAGIGSSVLAITNDFQVVLTRRGIETPVLPGMLYSPGGGVDLSQSPEENALREVEEEVYWKAGVHFDREDLTALAVVSDNMHQGGKHIRPEIVYALPLNISFREVQLLQQRGNKLKGKKEQDVWSLEGVIADQKNLKPLRDKILFAGNEMCAPTEAGLVHLLAHLELSSGMSNGLHMRETVKLMNLLRTFGREKFVVPIKKMVD